MRAGAPALALAVAVAAIAGTAHATTFAIVAAGTPAPLVVPSAETPNVPGSLVLPRDWTARAASVRALTFAEMQALWLRAGAAYRIPWQVLGAINKIETNFGRNMGPSSAGAVGWMQFMPETWLRWGMDGNGDGLADPWDPEDAIFAAARYLAAAGGADDLPRAVFAYNHADWYVEDVLDLAATFAASPGEVVFSLDRVQAGLEQAGRSVAAASEKLTAARREERRLGRLERRLLARAGSARLLTRRLELRARATRVGVRRERAAERVARLRSGLAGAEDALEEARAASAAASFSPAEASLLSGPVAAGGWVFPVGGGPAVVSVARTHHDYPAADIAAPSGAPAYALADALVERADTYPHSRCGIGATLRTGDGRSWTYCHLSYLEPGVVPGRVLPAGTPVGLVGSTGHSTGPHLHLQLQPAASYPQEEAWFQAFAGSAFRWQGEPAPRALASAGPAPPRGPVFAVVEDGPAAAGGVVYFTPEG